MNESERLSRGAKMADVKKRMSCAKRELQLQEDISVDAGWADGWARSAESWSSKRWKGKGVRFELKF